MKKIPLLLIAIFIITYDVSAQIKKGDAYFKNAQYAKAIPLYKKAVGKENGIEAIEKLANSYRLLKNYALAVHYYALLFSKTSPQPENYLNYAEVLMYSSKYDEAANYLHKYNDLVPADQKGILLLKALDELNALANQSPLFLVQSIEEINSLFSDYAPAIHREGLVFVSERKNDYVEQLRHDQNNNSNSGVYLSKYNKQDEKGEFKSPVNFSSKLSSDYQNGPVTFNAAYNTIVFSRTENKYKGKNVINRPKIYTATLVGDKLKEIKSFPYNSEDYSLGHPALTPDGKFLYFSSDMPGGFGGKDIYVSEFNGSIWEKPKNLGPVINTALDEVFPYISKNGNLYFSSNGHAGYGGQDIFTATGQATSWKDLLNLSAPLNSSYDDMSIVFNEAESEGFFSSNRPGGKGQDDIYKFRYTQNWVNIKGKLLLSENIDDGAPLVKLNAVSEEDSVINAASTDIKGHIHLRFLPEDKKFILKKDENTQGFPPGKIVYLADQNLNIIKKTTVDEDSSFAFYNLPFTDFKAGDPVVDDSHITLTGSVVAGNNPKIPLANQRINLVSKNGQKKYSTLTDSKGNYKFKNIPSGLDLAFVLPESGIKLTPNTRIVIADKNGNPIKIFFTDGAGSFQFEILKADYFTLQTLEEKDLAIKSIIRGKVFSDDKSKVPVEGITINLIDDRGQLFTYATTNSRGEFLFEGIKALGKYNINIESENLHLLFDALYLADHYGNIIRKIEFNNTLFNFEILPSDAYVLKTVKEEDNFAIKGKLLTDDKGTPAAGTRVNLINDKQQIIQTVETNLFGDFIFENLPPDNNYIVSISQTETTLKTKQLFLADANGNIIKEVTLNLDKFDFEVLPPVLTSLLVLEEDDTSFKMELKGRIVSDKDLKIPVNDLLVILMNEQGEQIQTIKTNDAGAFKFSNLDPTYNYNVDIDTENQQIKNKTLFLTDQHGNIIKSLGTFKDKFNFKLLPSDVAVLGRVEEFDTALRIELMGKIFQDETRVIPAAGAKVNLINEQGEIIQTAVVNNSGNFKFTNLPPDHNYIVSIENTDTDIKYKSLYLTDNKGNLIKSVTAAENGAFKFKLLPSEYNTIASISIEDTWIKIKDLKEKKTDKVIKIEYIHYNFDSHEILPEASRILDKAVRAMIDNPDILLEINGHTDSRGTYEYNQLLSERRAESAKNYIISKGIQTSRIKTMGYGEKKLLNHCKDGVSCADHLHKLNQRTEFEVTLK